MSTIPSWLQRNARRTPDRVAVHSLEQNVAVTHAELLHLCAQVAQAVATRGIGANDRVALIAHNSLEHLVTYLGVMSCGATICTIDPDVTTYAPGLARTLDPQLVLFGADEPPDLARTATELLPLGRLGQSGTGFCAGFSRAPAEKFAAVNSTNDVASIFYTSGTEATPKGIVCSFGELEANTEATADAFGITEADRVLEFRSFNWMSAQVLGGLATLSKGATLLLANGFSRSRFFAWIERHSATIATGNPTTINMLLNRPVEVERDSISQLRFVTSSSAPLLVEDWEAFEERYGIPIAQGYGSSETGWIAGSNESIRRLGSVGRPLPYQKVRIVDEAGEPLRTGEIGTVELGPDPPAKYRYLSTTGRVETSATGRIRTGDTGYLDADGFLFLTGRVKELIIRGGVNIAPVEIDAVISQLPSVAEALTIGVPDPIYGEEIVAYVAPREGARLDANSVLDHCRANLAETKVPKEIILRDSLPKTGRGKPDRAALAAEWERTERST